MSWLEIMTKCNWTIKQKHIRPCLVMTSLHSWLLTKAKFTQTFWLKIRKCIDLCCWFAKDMLWEVIHVSPCDRKLFQTSNVLPQTVWLKHGCRESVRQVSMERKMSLWAQPNSCTSKYMMWKCFFFFLFFFLN